MSIGDACGESPGDIPGLSPGDRLGEVVIMMLGWWSGRVSVILERDYCALRCNMWARPETREGGKGCSCGF